MSNRADKLLREILAADDAFPAEGSFRRYEEAKANARAYLNEKLHEPPWRGPDEGHDPFEFQRTARECASPPHAAAEPEKPICYLRMLNGKPDWDEHCVSTSPDDLMSDLDDAEPDEAYAIVPLYAAAPPPIAREPE